LSISLRSRQQNIHEGFLLRAQGIHVRDRPFTSRFSEPFIFPHRLAKCSTKLP
jgi:hypothetical protein